MITALLWPVKESFLEYLDMIEADIQASGAERSSDGFSFPAVGGAEELRFDGAVHITAHDGALDVTIARPRIGRAGEHVLLRIAGRDGDVDFARLLDYPEGDDQLRSEGGVLADVALTMDGAALLGGVYAPWTRLAPVTLVAATG